MEGSGLNCSDHMNDVDHMIPLLRGAVLIGTLRGARRINATRMLRWNIGVGWRTVSSPRGAQPFGTKSLSLEKKFGKENRDPII
jgi:hypothetical protein